MIRLKRILLGLSGGALLTLWALLSLSGETRQSPEAPSPRNLEDDDYLSPRQKETQPGGLCQAVNRYPPDIETGAVFQKLKFDPEWMEKREFWNVKFERRYSERRALWSKLPLQVFILPHSHNDPGWLKTLETYFASATHKILDNAVDKLSKYPNMTFIWTEISFLHMWWTSSSPSSRSRLRSLISSGRFEIASGGWVMPDEASVSLYSLLDQLTEGHSWLVTTLGVKPRVSWSIDPFGHGNTLPYILQESGLSGHMIMRIHYAWKEWFAKNQLGDFIWRQEWDSEGGILTHNFPYDIYSIKGSCGPSAAVCLEYNYRRLPGEYNEYRYTPVTSQNVQERAEKLLEQYGKTGSLYPHNVVLVPLGDDFTYAEGLEWDQQYANYQKIINFINADPSYGAEIRFGTLSDYFGAVNERMSEFKSLSGDFFPYADVFSEGRPAYWSGYYTSRPRMKAYAREVEASLRTAEILFTLAYNAARLSANDPFIEEMQAVYGESLVPARRNSAVFQHHDALTGTSKQYVMDDYELKLRKALGGTHTAQRSSLRYFLGGQSPRPSARLGANEDLLVFNSHLNRIEDVVAIQFPASGKSVRLKVVDLKDPSRTLPLQVSPVIKADGTLCLDVVEVSFFVEMDGLSLSKYRILPDPDPEEDIRPTTFYSSEDTFRNFSHPGVVLSGMSEEDISLENRVYQLVIGSGARFLSSLKHKPSGTSDNLEIYFGKYPTSQFRSGAYLFKPVSGESVSDMFDPSRHPVKLACVSGQIYSEFSIFIKVPLEENESLGASFGPESRAGAFKHSIRLYHARAESPLARGIRILNDFDLGGSLLNRDIDLFMRLSSEIIDNGRLPVLYSDASGLSMARRVKVESLGPEGNYWPATSAAFIEDEDVRLSLLMDHAVGVSGPETGMVEVMVDRRSSYDDSRGMGEGVLDSSATKHNYWLLFEPKQGTSLDSVPGLSPLAGHLLSTLNYPLNTFAVPEKEEVSTFPFGVSLLSPTHPLKCTDAKLLNFRTQSLPGTTPDNIPSQSALLTLHWNGPDCNFSPVEGTCRPPKYLRLKELFIPETLRVSKAIRTSLTGLHEDEENDTPRESPLLKGLATYRLSF